MFDGGMWTVIFSVLGSIRASAPRETCALNQMTPFSSRMSHARCGIAVRSVDLERLELAGLGVDAADRHGLVLRHRGEPEIAVKVGRRVMRSEPPREVVPIVQSLLLIGGMREEAGRPD